MRNAGKTTCEIECIMITKAKSDGMDHIQRVSKLVQGQYWPVWGSNPRIRVISTTAL